MDYLHYLLNWDRNVVPNRTPDTDEWASHLLEALEHEHAQVMDDGTVDVQFQTDDPQHRFAVETILLDTAKLLAADIQADVFVFRSENGGAFDLVGGRF